MNFEFIATYVELQDIPSYSTNITVEGQLLKLSFLWNERIGKRVLSIKNTSDVVYLQNTILYHNEPLELNSNAVLDDLPYSVTLVKTGDNKVGNIFNWSKDFILCFSRTVDLDVKKLNVVYGVTTPSTPILPPSNGGGNGNGGDGNISKEGASGYFALPQMSSGYDYHFSDCEVFVNGRSAGILQIGSDDLNQDVVSSARALGLEIHQYYQRAWRFTNISNDFIKVKLRSVDDAAFTILGSVYEQNDPSIYYTVIEYNAIHDVSFVHTLDAYLSPL